MVGTVVLTGHQKERRESCSHVVLEGLQQRALAVFWKKRTVSCLLGWDNGMRVEAWAKDGEGAGGKLRFYLEDGGSNQFPLEKQKKRLALER